MLLIFSGAVQTENVFRFSICDLSTADNFFDVHCSCSRIMFGHFAGLGFFSRFSFFLFFVFESFRVRFGLFFVHFLDHFCPFFGIFLSIFWTIFVYFWGVRE